MPELHRLPGTTLVIVCDVRKALFLRNAGTPIHPSLETLHTLEAEPASAEHDLEGNAPGRKPDMRSGDGSHDGPRSAMEPTDYEHLDEAAFAAKITGELPAMMEEAGAKDVVLVASPSLLGELRQALPEQLHDKVVAEIPKTLTNNPVDEIAGHLVDF